MAWWRIYVSVSSIVSSSGNGYVPGRRRAINWTSNFVSDLFSSAPQGTNVNEILIKIHIFSFKKMHLSMSSAKVQPVCSGLIASSY